MTPPYSLKTGLEKETSGAKAPKSEYITLCHEFLLPRTGRLLTMSAANRRVS
jgi:hypothetical protein